MTNETKWTAFDTKAEGRWIVDTNINAELEKVADALNRQHAAQLNDWTRDEFVRLLGQVIASGDFKLLVAPDNRYGAVYLPWDECERLRAKVRELEQELEPYRLCVDPELA